MAPTPITAGPCKFDLSIALFKREATVKFTVDGKQIEVCILQIQAEDGSRESWNLIGYVIGAGCSPSKNFRAYYHTQRRKGHFEVID